MNKNTYLIAAILTSCLVWAGCSKSGKLDTVSTFKPPAGPVELKLKWPLGERVVRGFDMKMNSEISVPGQPNPIKQDINMGQEYALTVLKEEAGGGHELELEFLTVRMTMVMGGKTVADYDSTQKPSKDSKNPMTATFQKTFQNMIGAKLQYYLDASNQVERIEGIDALMNRMSAGGQANAAAGMKNMFNEGYLKQMVGGSQYLPTKPVQPGDTWPVHTDVAMGDMGDMTMDYNFTFQNWETLGKRTCARQEFQGTISSKPDTNSNPTGMTMTVQDGTCSGVSWFDPELGMDIETDLNQDMKMIMTFPMNARGKATTQTMTNLMHQAIIIKVESVK